MKSISKVLAVAIITLQLSVPATTLAASVPLSDIDNHAYQTAIEYLYTKKVISGYDNGTFKPNNTINRAELLKILVGGAGYQKPDATKYQNCFPDVKNEWYAPYVCFAKEKGWVQGYDDGKFRPAQMINKVEAMKMLISSQGFPPALNAGANASMYADVNLKLWYGQYMFVAEAMKIIDFSGSKYYPSAFITRGEISNNIYRAMLIIEQQVGSFDQVKVPGSAGSSLQPPASVFNATSLTVSSPTPISIVLKFGAPAVTGTGSLTTYVLESKMSSEQIYTPADYSVAYYNAKEKTDGGIVFVSKPSTTYNFRVRAVNSNGQESVTSEVKTITTAAALEPDRPTIEVVSQTYNDITLKVTLPQYTGNSALQSLFDSFTNPNSGMGQSGSMNIEGMKIVGSYTTKINLFPKLEDAVPPTYTFQYWVDNKSGKVSEKASISVVGLSSKPAAPTISTKTVTKNNITFDMKPATYTGSSAIDKYAYSVDSTSDPTGGNTSSGGSYGKTYFEENLKYALTLGSNLPANTTYTVSFWVVNLDGKISDKVTKTVTTSAN